MQWLSVWCVVAMAVYGGGGVTQTDPQLWADYKIFDHVYGKVFDKDLYGDGLPPTIRFGDTNKYKKDTIFGDAKASEKKEIYTFPTDENYDILKDSSNFNFHKEKPFNFVSFSGFKPISESNDPETYNYLKRLEAMEREREITDFNPVNEKPEETYAYKVIQNILDAHEANKGGQEESSHFSHKEMNNKKNKRKPTRMTNEGVKRCYQGRCRKRSSGSNTRVRTWPYYKKIKYRFY